MFSKLNSIGVEIATEEFRDTPSPIYKSSKVIKNTTLKTKQTMTFPKLTNCRCLHMCPSVMIFENEYKQDSVILTKHSVFINGYIRYDATFYTPLIKLLLAPETKKVDIYLSSCGGSVNGGVYILTAMQQSNAEITTYAYGLIASMATMIWCAGDNLVCSDKAILMWHGIQSGMFGGIKCIQDKLDSLKEVNKKFFKDILERKILTQEEFNQILEDEDLYLFGFQMKERNKEIE